MKRILPLLSYILCIAVTAHAQTCPAIDGMAPIVIRYGVNDSNFPTIPLYWNRFFKVDETTGIVGSVTCSYTGDPNLHEFAYSVGYLTGIYLRMVTDACDPTLCGGYLPAQPMPKTNNSNGSSAWSQGATWAAGVVPDISSSIAALITKSTQIDQDLNMPGNHWLSFSAGNSSILAGATVVCNSVIQVYNGAQLENFGTLKGNGVLLGSLTNSGVLAPGNSPGRFSITGNYTATSTAVHQLEIAAADSYDTITVTQDASAPGGVAVLNGTLNVSLLNSYAPSSGEVYKIMTYTSATGTFATVNLPALRSGLSWGLNYNVNDITLQVNGVLPVSIVSFTADRKNNGVQAAWTTASEVNVKNYEVQKSADGVSFSNAGSVNANNGATNQYTWFDAAPLNGRNYYRIKAIDVDGAAKYSKILAIDVLMNGAIKAYPNPVKRGDAMQLNLQNTVASKVQIINATGQVLYSKTGKLSGVVTIPIAAAWPFGQYMLQIIADNKMQTQKILVQ